MVKYNILKINNFKNYFIYGSYINILDYSGGKGKMGGHNCPVCRGKKVKQEIVEKTIDVKPGMTVNTLKILNFINIFI